MVELDQFTVDESTPPRMTPELLRVQVPEGYTEERIAAPAAAPPKGPEVAKPTEASGAAPTKAATDPVPVAPAIPQPPALSQGPDFELPTPGGAKVSLGSLKGNIVVLEFAGSWCLPCRHAHPELQESLGAYEGKPVKVFMLSVREKVREAAADDVRARGHTFGVLLDADAVAKQYNVRSYPTYFVLGRDGEVLKMIGGYTKGETIAEVKRVVDEALAK